MEQMVRCSNCGMENPAGQQFCGKCGAKLVTEVQQQKIKCPKCGFQNLAGQQFCGSCGASLAATVQQVPTAPTQGAPTKVASSAAYRQGVEVKPTWGLAWGLWWRMLVLGLLIGGIIYLIIAIVMVLAFNYKLPFGA
ncbi:MAG: zinc ribbon domain-containing protein [Chloroflexi bacterium]|nr:zinc ribbon domain-containing protein [Chloroflexota bacterium]